MDGTQDPVKKGKNWEVKADKNAKSKAKAEAIDKAVDHCRRDQSLSLTKAAIIYGCSKQSISNHIKANSLIRYSSDVHNNHQRLTLAEEAALVKHISECYLSGFPLYVPHFNDFANEVLRSRGDQVLVSVNWHLKFFKRHRHMKTKFSRPFARVHMMQEKAEIYIEFFEQFSMLCKKWGIQKKIVYNMDESGCLIGFHQKSQVIVLGDEVEAVAIAATDGNWE